MKDGANQPAVDDMSPEAVGYRLALIREAFGLSKSEVADMLGFERIYWSRWELGQKSIPVSQAHRLVHRFGVTLDYIYLGRIGGLSFSVVEKLRATGAIGESPCSATVQPMVSGNACTIEDAGDDCDAVAARLKRVREILGHNRKDFAERAGLSEQNYGQFENARRDLTLDAAKKLRKAYGLPLEFIYFGRTDDLPVRIYRKL